ncbi:MAG: 4'-phosphopantetheinyl transferase superfamily protein [Alistipes sp.]|nr:4'-phosphopantetheinyl transferase superfamily protein [Alistipes senegalensis]MCM1251010.1 4'-phosphopantetheinyl transferase superfamily protein [Alistipes sp.]
MFRLLLSQPLSDADFALWTLPSELAAAAGFAPERRSEWLSWRALVRRELCTSTDCDPLEVRFSYSDLGAPLIVGSPLRLSVSHCEGSIAVALSEFPCAVDVESLDRRFGRVVSRYMTSAEWSLSEDPRWPAVVWCAKECLYKFAGRCELDLLRDLRIEAVDFSAATLVGRIGSGPALTLRFLFFADRVVVYLS